MRSEYTTMTKICMIRNHNKQHFYAYSGSGAFKLYLETTEDFSKYIQRICGIDIEPNIELIEAFHSPISHTETLLGHHNLFVFFPKFNTIIIPPRDIFMVLLFITLPLFRLVCHRTVTRLINHRTCSLQKRLPPTHLVRSPPHLVDNHPRLNQVSLLIRVILPRRRRTHRALIQCLLHRLLLPQLTTITTTTMQHIGQVPQAVHKLVESLQRQSLLNSDLISQWLANQRLRRSRKIHNHNQHNNHNQGRVDPHFSAGWTVAAPSLSQEEEEEELEMEQLHNNNSNHN